MTEEVSINHALANKNDGVIYKTSISCLERFHNLTKRANTSVVLDPGRLHVEPGAQLPFMEDMARSFNIWIDYTGAMADHSRCLDSRLRGYDDIRDMVLELLELLEMNLDYSMSKREAIYTRVESQIMLLTITSGAPGLRSRIRRRGHGIYPRSR